MQCAWRCEGGFGNHIRQLSRPETEVLRVDAPTKVEISLIGEPDLVEKVAIVVSAPRKLAAVQHSRLFCRYLLMFGEQAPYREIADSQSWPAGELLSCCSSALGSTASGTCSGSAAEPSVSSPRNQAFFFSSSGRNDPSSCSRHCHGPEASQPNSKLHFVMTPYRS